MFVCVYLLVGLNLVAVILGNAIANLESAQRKDQLQTTALGIQMSVHLRSLLVNVVIVLCTITVGIIYYSVGQGLSVTDAVYFTIETLTTVGYGDTNGVNEKTTGEWWFSIVFVAFGVVSFTMCLGNIASIVAELKLKRRMQRLVKQGITSDMIKSMDKDGSGDVDRLEFLSHMLVEWGRCSEDDIIQINNLFDTLDVDQGGTLNEADVFYHDLDEDDDEGPAYGRGLQANNAVDINGDSRRSSAPVLFFHDNSVTPK